MLIPYNVDRPARHVPVVTYALMGINIFLFFATVFISNVNLPADRQYGRQEAARLLNEKVAGDSALQETFKSAREAAPEMFDRNGQVLFPDKFSDDSDTAGRINPFSRKGQKIMARRALWQTALSAAYAKADNEAGYQRAWQIQYMDSSFVLTPHYSALEWFAYRPGEESVIGKLLGLLGSMFLHGGFEHILGNMLFLWIFGRAVEDSLGPRVYLGAYLLCGVAATLLHHIMTLQFHPAGMMIPSFGASGAIAGVMGLFAPRFYRTPVRFFYLLPTAIAAGAAGFAVLFIIAAMLTADPIVSSVLAIVCVLAGLYYFGKVWAWGAKKAPAAAFLAFYVGYFDLFPALKSLTAGGDTGDGVAHWAHIGGFLFGMLYALMIGQQKEGKQEFMLEDAEKAYGLGDNAGAVSYSQNLLEREPGNPGAYEILAKSYMKQNSESEALDNFELAINNYLRVGERPKAAACYLMATEKYPLFILPAPTQLAVGNQLAKDNSLQQAAETLVKIPYTFPDAPEGEVALLRASQLYLQHLNQPQMTVQLLQFFLQKYPESQWMPQVERAWKMAHHQLNAPPGPEAGSASVLEAGGAGGTPNATASHPSQATPPRGARTQKMPSANAASRPPAGH